MVNHTDHENINNNQILTKRSELLLQIVSLLIISLLVYGICFVDFGLLRGKVGFYWDDWPVVWSYYTMGLEGIKNYFKGGRPFYGMCYSLVFPILGISTIKWQLFAIMLRWLCSVSILMLLRTLWPVKRSAAWLVSVFGLLYPGFGQQSISLTYSPHYISLILCILSLIMTICSLRATQYKLLYMVLSLGAGLLGYLIIEYFLGLELLRAVIILYVISENNREDTLRNVVKTIKAWCPYCVILICYLIWRVILFKSILSYQDGTTQLSHIVKNPIIELALRFVGAIQNLLMATLMSWSRTLSPDILNYDKNTVILSWIIGVLVAGITAVIFVLANNKMQKNNDEKIQPMPMHIIGNDVVKLGLFALLFAGMPLMLAGLKINYDVGTSFNDRLALPYLFGASLLSVGLLLSVHMNKKQRLTSLCVIIFFFSSFQILRGDYFQTEWQKERMFFWQFYWRYPNIQPQSSLFVYPVPDTIYGNHSGGMIDLLYCEKHLPGEYHYFIFDIKNKITSNLDVFEPGSTFISSFKNNAILKGGVRSYKYEGTTSKCIVVWNAPTGTMRVIDRKYADEVPDLPASCRPFVHLSNSSAVTQQFAENITDRPLLTIFGPEPSHGWTFYYQKADLERQNSNWGLVAAYGDEVRKKGLSPDDFSEWFPFIEGYAMAHQYDRSLGLTVLALKKNPKLFASLSALWNRLLRSDAAIYSGMGRGLDTLRDILEIS